MMILRFKPEYLNAHYSSRLNREFWKRKCLEGGNGRADRKKDTREAENLYNAVSSKPTGKFPEVRRPNTSKLYREVKEDDFRRRRPLAGECVSGDLHVQSKSGAVEGKDCGSHGWVAGPRHLAIITNSKKACQIVCLSVRGVITYMSPGLTWFSLKIQNQYPFICQVLPTIWPLSTSRSWSL